MGGGKILRGPWVRVRSRGRTRFVWYQGVLLFGIVALGVLSPTASAWLSTGLEGVYRFWFGPRWWLNVMIDLPLSIAAGYVFGTLVWRQMERFHPAGSPGNSRVAGC
jgi:hypothetical protein